MTESTEELKEKLQSQMHEAEKAQEYLEHPLTQGFLMAIRATLYESFGKVSEERKDKLEEIWRMMRTVNKFEEMLTEYVETGKIAKHNWLDMFDKE